MALLTAPALFRAACLAWMPKLIADFGFDEFDAAAIMGNCGHESNGLRAMQEVKPTVRGSRGGLGAFQWTGPRRVAFEAWLKRKKAPANDLDASYGFLFRELKGPEKAAIAKTKKAVGLDAKAEAFERAFERAGVKHYPSRKAWAQVALSIYRQAPKPAPAAPAAPVPPPAPAKPDVATAAPQLGASTWWERLLGFGRKAPALVGTNKGEETLFRAQNQLLAAGYTEVGDPDGRWGTNTRGAVDALLREQFPSVAAPASWPMSDEVLAAIAKAERRQVAADRAGVTVGELRTRGSTPIKAPIALTTGGGLLSFLGIGKALEETGIPGKITAVSDQASEIMTTVQTAIGVFGTVFSLAFRFWWLILIVVGVIWAAKGLRWALEIRALARQGSIRQTGL
jgi:hypothetical protein